MKLPIENSCCNRGTGQSCPEFGSIDQWVVSSWREERQKEVCAQALHGVHTADANPSSESATRFGVMTSLRYGHWPSPISPEALTIGDPTLDEPRLDGEDTYWLEGRPTEAGRVVLVCHGADGRARDVTPARFNVRSRVHEYGGGAYAVREGMVVFSNFVDGRLYRLDRDSAQPVAITAADEAVRFGAVVLHGQRIYAVREDHRAGGEAVNELVWLPLHPDSPGVGEVIAGGTDFVSRPAISPDGERIAWVSWNHPNMPWDSTILEVAALSDPVATRRTVAGGPGISVVQPQFSPRGDLWFISDASGYWNLMRWSGGETAAQPVHHLAADVADPQWLLGFIDFALIDDDTAFFRYFVDATAVPAVLDARTGEHRLVHLEGVAFTHLQVRGSDLLALRGRAEGGPQIVRGPLDGPVRVLAGSLEDADPEYLSRAVAKTWTNTAGQQTHGFFYPPVNGQVQLSGDSAPPVIVVVHGGPTSHAMPTYKQQIQFWTTRGFAVFDVNHGGSTAYGRAFRERLNGQWGVVDIDDTVCGVRALAAEGAIDATAVFIRGGSAGGYTTLRALTASTAFAAGASYFGISDLALLVADDHKFESRYTTTLVGPWPQDEAVYRERSPIHHLADLHGELLLLQGADDMVVKENQATRMAEALSALGKAVELVVYPGEGHGFRQAQTIVDSLNRELALYQRCIDAAAAGQA